MRLREAGTLKDCWYNYQLQKIFLEGNLAICSKFKCTFTDPAIPLLKIHANNQMSVQRYSTRIFY